MSESLGLIPLPVAIVAAAARNERGCATGTLAYVSYSPPLIATSLNAASRTYRLLAESGEFSLSILGEGQAELAVQAAAPSEGDTFAEFGIPLLESPVGRSAPGVAGATVLWCDLESATQAGSSVLCVGKVADWRAGEGSPLLRFSHRYRALGSAVDVTDEAPYPL